MTTIKSAEEAFNRFEWHVMVLQTEGEMSKAEALAAMEAAVLERVNETRELYFSKDMPVFTSMEEYMEHTVKIRDKLRAEIAADLVAFFHPQQSEEKV